MTICYKSLVALLLTFLITLSCSCGKRDKTLVKDGYDQKEMDAAIARAKGEVENFIAELAKRDGSDFAVKAPIEDKGETEHFWLSEVAYNNGEFTGLIANDPGMVTNVKIGQKWTIKKGDLSDWMFMRGGKMHGNYTLRPLLKTMPKEEAESLKSMLANP